MLFWGREGGGSTLLETERQIWRVRLQHLYVKGNLTYIIGFFLVDKTKKHHKTPPKTVNFLKYFE